jgi:hypothetical protein
VAYLQSPSGHPIRWTGFAAKVPSHDAWNGHLPVEPEGLLEEVLRRIDEIVVESRACIQPYFVWPGVRMVEPSRRRRLQYAKNSVPGPSFKVPLGTAIDPFLARSRLVPNGRSEAKWWPHLWPKEFDPRVLATPL